MKRIIAASTIVIGVLILTLGTDAQPTHSQTQTATRSSSPQTEADLRKLSKQAKKRAKRKLSIPPAITTDKCFTWNEPWIDGDCELSGPPNQAGLTGPVICFHSDGTGTYRSRGRSTDDDDTYVVRFDVVKENNQLLFRVPEGTIFLGLPRFWSVELPNPGNWYDFNQDFTFPAGQFSAIVTVIPYSGC